VTCGGDVKDFLVKVKMGKREKTPISVHVIDGVRYGKKAVVACW
jgi:hypothetical protein